MMQTHCNNVSVSGCVVQGTEAPPAAASLLFQREVWLTVRENILSDMTPTLP